MLGLLRFAQHAFIQPDAAGRTLQRREMLAAAGLAGVDLRSFCFKNQNLDSRSVAYKLVYLFIL